MPLETAVSVLRSPPFLRFSVSVQDLELTMNFGGTEGTGGRRRPFPSHSSASLRVPPHLRGRQFTPCTTSRDDGRTLAPRPLDELRERERGVDERAEDGLRVAIGVDGGRFVRFDVETDRRADGTGAAQTEDDA